MSHLQNPFDLPAPQADDAERALLCAMMMVSSGMAWEAGSDGAQARATALAALVGPGDFGDPRHAALYETILILHHAGKGCDPVSVQTLLKERNLWAQVNGQEETPDYFLEVCDAVPTVSSARHHAALIAETANRRRRMLELSREYVQAAQGGGAAGGGGWPTPRPLAHRDLPALHLAEPLAPAWVADMAAETARHVQVDPGAVGMVALGILSGALCRTRFQVETNAGHFQPLAFYAVILASPSERKSGYFRALMAPVWELREKAVEEFGPACAAWAEAQIKAKRRRKPGADDAPAPAFPPAHGDGRFLFEDFTEAALAVGLENCAEAGLIATAEGGLLFDNIGGKLSKGNGPGFDGTILLKAYDREFCDIRRITRAPITLKHPSLALATTAQPGPVFEAFKNPAFRNRGLVSRLALALPPSLAGGREAQTERIPQAVANRWAQEIMEEGMRAMKHVSAPQTIRMSDDARAAWVAYFMELEAGQKPGGRFEELGDWTGKHADRVARVAAVCHVAAHGRDAARHEITGERMAAAVEFGRALVGHAEAVILCQHRPQGARNNIMASASKQGALYRFEWRDPHTGESHRVGLSGLNKRQADQIKGWIQDLADAMKSGTPAPVEAAGWLLRLPPAIHAKFAEAGLAPTRKARGLEAFCNEAIQDKKEVLSAATLFHYDIAKREACAFFGKDRDIATLTPGDALNFNRHLRARGAKVSTANKRCATMRAIFQDAKRHQLIQENPWADKAVPKSSPPATDEKRVFVHHEDAVKIMEELPHPEMRALFAFARWAGTRQREPLGMKWEHVRFGTPEAPGHVLIPNDKTKHATGEAWRKCAMFPEVEAALLELQEAAPAGEDYLFPHYRTQGTNATTSALLKAMKRAGVEYKAPWQNLRRTRSTELADRLPAHVVSAWMGHNDEIANAHYRRPTDDHYTAAAMFQTGGGGGGGGMSKTDENLEKLRADAVAIVEAKTRKIPDNSAVEARKPLKNKGFPLALVGIEPTLERF